VIAAAVSATWAAVQIRRLMALPSTTCQHLLADDDEASVRMLTVSSVSGRC
jgi:hypothetical protein